MKLLCEDEVFSEDGVPSQYGGTSQLLEVYLERCSPCGPAQSPARYGAQEGVHLCEGDVCG